MSIEVKHPGLLTTIQDLGRYSFQKYGVVVSGAMDDFSFKLANLLVDNDLNKAALEFTLIGPELVFHKDTIIAICGGDFRATINDFPVPLWRPVYVRKGTVLKIGNCSKGSRGYLAIQGGIDTEISLNSRSTYLSGKLGGMRGEKLVSGDILPTKRLKDVTTMSENFPLQRAEGFRTTRWFLKVPSSLLYSSVIRAMVSRQYDLFTEQSKLIFFDTKYKISADSDRMGYRLNGQSLQLTEEVEVISEGIVFGTVQVPHDGQPIVLMADRQTTGGYPKIANVISVDLPILAQKKPGDIVKFEKVTIEEAQQLYLQKEKTVYYFSKLIRNLYNNCLSLYR